jgi:hypothetical protein
MDELAGRFVGVYVLKHMTWVEEWLLKWNSAKQDSIRMSFNRDVLRPDKVKPFLKREVCRSYPTKGRAIQAYANEVTSAFYGASFYAYTKALVEACDVAPISYGGIVFDLKIASGMNHEAIGQWMTDLPPGLLFYERDGKNWDSTMGSNHFELVHQFLALCGDGLSRFRKACENVRGHYSRKNVGFIRYKAIGTVKSGHQDTTGSNSLINLGCIVRAILNLETKPTRVFIIVNGDDCLAAGDFPCTATELLNAESDLGIVPEGALFRDPIDTSFLSGTWYPKIGGGYAFGPKMGRLLRGLFWTTSAAALKDPIGWKSTVARSFLEFWDENPIMSVFLRRNITTSRVVVIEKWNKTHSKIANVDWEYYFSAKYQLDTNQIDEIVTYLNRLPRVNICLANKALRRIVELDLLDPAEREYVF